MSAETNLIDPASPTARALFEAGGVSDVLAIKIGYFPYKGSFSAGLEDAKRRLAGFATLARRTGVKACVHTHSGNYIGSNCESLRWLLADFDPHHVGAFVDTGHQTVGGAPFRIALDLVAPWLTLLAIKDISWTKTSAGWKKEVVPAGEGIVDWKEVAAAVKDRRFDGVVSLHGEYEAKDLADRQEKARAELRFLKDKVLTNVSSTR